MSTDLRRLRKEEAREEPPDRAEIRDLQAELPISEAAAERTARRLLRSAIPKDERRRKKEISTLNSIRRILRKLPSQDAKTEALVEELRSVFRDDPSEKVIVFTEYRDTLNAIQERLNTDPDLARRYVILTGGLSRKQRLKRQAEFEALDTRLLIATDAASEGLNLQRHCRRVIHFELPWNPNRLEQRNGRVDRYGQMRNPLIKYLYYPDSPEENVLDQLVRKIENIAKDRVSTPDILGVIAGQREIEQNLVEMDPAAADIETKKTVLVQLFEDRTADFVRNVQPLLTGGTDCEREVKRVFDLLDTAEPLLADDAHLEETVLALLGEDAVTRSASADGLFRIVVPMAFRGSGVRPVYPAATFRRSVAVRYRTDEVEYITALHPLVQAMGSESRRRLLQVYSSARGLSPRRLAARTAKPGEPPAVVFTFLGAIKGGSGLLEEVIIPIRLDSTGEVLDDPESNSRFLTERETEDEFEPEAISRFFAGCFDALRARAVEEARKWLRVRGEQLRRRRFEQAEILKRDLEVDLADRLREITDEESRARGVDEAGQQRLFAEDGRSGGFAARRAAANAYAAHRLEEIAEFDRVEEPEEPRPMGALLLLPGGGVA